MAARHRTLPDRAASNAVQDRRACDPLHLSCAELPACRPIQPTGSAWLTLQIVPDDERSATARNVHELDRLSDDHADLDREIGVQDQAHGDRRLTKAIREALRKPTSLAEDHALEQFGLEESTQAQTDQGRCEDIRADHPGCDPTRH